MIQPLLFALFFLLTSCLLESTVAQFGNHHVNGASTTTSSSSSTGSQHNSHNADKLTLTRIRSHDGSEDTRAGNNAQLLRLSGPPSYPDGQGLLLSMIKHPNARGISNIVSDSNRTPPPTTKSRASDMFWQWGEFISHDMSLTPGQDEAYTITSPDCETGDVLCTIPFRRATHKFVDGVRQQINQITGFLDASMVYGHTEERARELRTLVGGRLALTTSGLLPGNPHDFANTRIPDDDIDDNTNLFLAGDARVNEHVGLIAMHTLWVREHNRIANRIPQVFSGESDDERIYQMTRKMVMAEIQIITYREFLPILVGSTAPRLDAYQGCDGTVNPAISQEFAAVAFRFGHSMISSDLLLHDGTTHTGSIHLLDAFFNPTLFHNGTISVDEVLIGQTKQACNVANTKVVPEVRNFLFGHSVGGAGLDLVTLTIQRGRDHGVPLYNDMRAGMGLTRLSSFEQVTGGDSTIAAELGLAYPNGIDSCDAWICGLAEPAINGGQVGELFSRIIADQFHRLLDGDEFFYLNDPDLQDDRLHSVIDFENVTLARVINDNTAGGGVVGDAMLAQ